jgi:hypothetical protein
MPVILIVERTGNIKETNIKLFEEEQLYKKAGFKTPNDFGKIAVFPHLSNHQIHVYGKTKGKAGQENKYDFPPPIDSTLFFGNCVLVQTRSVTKSPAELVVEGLRPSDHKETDEKICDLSLTEWEKIYEKLFGGFEDIEDSSEEEEMDEEEMKIMMDPNTKFTKEGYVKDDFIVDDDELDDDELDEDELDDEDDYDDTDENDDDSIPKKKTVVKKTKKAFKEVEVVKVKKQRKPYTKATVSSEKVKKTAEKKSKKAQISNEESEKDARTDLIDELEEEEYFQ